MIDLSLPPHNQKKKQTNKQTKCVARRKGIIQGSK